MAWAWSVDNGSDPRDRASMMTKSLPQPFILKYRIEPYVGRFAALRHGGNAAPLRFDGPLFPSRGQSAC
jgi:hypothetical protein